MLLPFLHFVKSQGKILTLQENSTVIEFLLQGNRAVLSEMDCLRYPDSSEYKALGNRNQKLQP